MERVIVAEVLDRRGHVRSRVRIDRFPFRIGRAYTNDLILDDPHVSPEHVRIELDSAGDVVARDLESTNGLHHLEPPARVDAVKLTGGGVVRIGETVLRFRTPDHRVEPAVAVRRPGEVGPHWTHSHVTGVLALLALVATSIASSVRESYSELEPNGLAGSALALVLAVLVWSSAWSLAGRLLRQQALFAAHWVATSLFALADAASDAVFRHVRFLFASIEGVEAVELFVELALFTALLAFQLKLATGLARTSRALAASGVAALVTVTTTIWNSQGGEEWISAIPFWSRLEPVDTAWLPTRKVDEFFVDVAQLKSEVDDLALED